MNNETSPAPPACGVLDAIVVGAGFAGLYMSKRLVDLGLTFKCFEAGDGVGGTWYWNRYPGAQCNVESLEYSYSFSDDLQQEWNWSHRFASQAEILEYANHVADRFDLRGHIQFNTRVLAINYDDAAGIYTVEFAAGESVRARYCIVASGNLSTPRVPDFVGLERFKGEWHHSSRWPDQGVDVAGKRVAIIGTGSTGIQLIPIMAQRAAQLYVFQRSPNFVLPSQNSPLDPQYLRDYKAVYPKTRLTAQHSQYGVADLPIPQHCALEVTPQARASEASVSGLFDHVEAAVGPIAVLACFAGIGRLKGAQTGVALVDVSSEEWDAVMDINARGTFLCVREMLRRRGSRPVEHGRILVVSSVAGQFGAIRSGAVYSASKGAVLSLMKVAAREAAPLGITVNAIAPGPVDTPLLTTVAGNDLSSVTAVVPLKRIGVPADVAAAAAYLVSAEASWVTGATLDVNGGIQMR